MGALMLVPLGVCTPAAHLHDHASGPSGSPQLLIPSKANKTVTQLHAAERSILCVLSSTV